MLALLLNKLNCTESRENISTSFVPDIIINATATYLLPYEISRCALREHFFKVVHEDRDLFSVLLSELFL